MIDLRRASRLAALFASVAMILVACGGSGATPTPTPVGEATPPAEATPATEPTPVGEATPVDDIPSFDLGALTGVIPGVDSYRTSFSIDGVEQYQSVVVTKPVLSKATTILDQGAVTTRFIVIGADAWLANGPAGKFESVPPEQANMMLLAFDPALMLGAYAGLNVAGGAADQGTEDKNGVQARHLRIDPTTTIGVAAAMPAGSAIDIWVAEAGYLVAWEMSGMPSDSNISIQVTGVNDPANKVEAPPS
jgi:hypothetical protein